MYTIVALLVAALLMYVMQKVEYDRWSKTDSLWLQWVRRFAFCSTAIMLLYSIQSSDWQLTSLFMVSCSAVILIINVIALHQRSIPYSGHKVRVLHQRGFSRLMVRVVHYFSYGKAGR